MSRSLCLSHQCLGLVTRIECTVRPLGDNQGRWVVLCAAGLDAAQPSAVRVLGPFQGECAAEQVMYEIGRNLQLQGYTPGSEPMIWQLHLRAALCRPPAQERAGCAEVCHLQRD
ncbi:hypothetical protein NCCP436_30450 [Pseudomonas sp. NCCP-436]|nr:hypothetical protein NCCP436_30450 [Pseudomonas sp. NCCP-436]